jgi:hypothetical protein
MQKNEVILRQKIRGKWKQLTTAEIHFPEKRVKDIPKRVDNIDIIINAHPTI